MPRLPRHTEPGECRSLQMRQPPGRRAQKASARPSKRGLVSRLVGSFSLLRDKVIRTYLAFGIQPCGSCSATWTVRRVFAYEPAQQPMLFKRHVPPILSPVFTVLSIFCSVTALNPPSVASRAGDTFRSNRYIRLPMSHSQNTSLCGASGLPPKRTLPKPITPKPLITERSSSPSNTK